MFWIAITVFSVCVLITTYCIYDHRRITQIINPTENEIGKRQLLAMISVVTGALAAGAFMSIWYTDIIAVNASIAAAGLIIALMNIARASWSKERTLAYKERLRSIPGAVNEPSWERDP